MERKRKILLLGDSIRCGAGESVGYGRMVAERLKEVADVCQPTDNCRFTVYTLRYVREWADAVGGQADIVYWNNGLWDVVRVDGDDPLIGAEEYGKFLRRIFLRLREIFPSASIVFAYSTPVIEERQEKSFGRVNREIEEYNEVAARVLVPLGAYIDDLYSVARDFGEKYRCDAVHFDDEGCRRLAEHVVGTLLLRMKGGENEV